MYYGFKKARRRSSVLGVGVLGAAALMFGLLFSLNAPALAQSVPGPGMMNGSSQDNSQYGPGSGINNGSSPDNPSPFNSQNSNNLPQSYDNNTLNYTISYPSGWNYTSQSDGTTVFQGPNNATVTIAPETGSDLKTVATDLKNAYTSDPASHAQITNVQDFNYSSNGNSATGQYFQVNYTDPASNENYQALVVVLPANGQVNSNSSGSGNDFLGFTYSAPASQFGTYSGDAREMFDSWTISQ